MQTEKQEVLLSLYEDYREHARHSESTREGINNFILALLAAILTVIVEYNREGSDKIFGCEDRYLILLLIIMSILGLLSFVSYTERYHRSKIRAAYIRHYLDESLFINKNKNYDNKSIKIIKKNADKEHYNHLVNVFTLGSIKENNAELKTSFSLIKSLHHIISLLFLIVILICGLILMGISMFNCGFSKAIEFCLILLLVVVCSILLIKLLIFIIKRNFNNSNAN